MKNSDVPKLANSPKPDCDRGSDTTLAVIPIDSSTPVCGRGSDMTLAKRSIGNDMPGETDQIVVKGEQCQNGDLSDEDDTSPSFITWGKTSVLSEVDIADLYGDLE